MRCIEPEEHRGYAAHHARAFCRRFPHLQGADIDDAKQEAFIAIMSAAVKWDGVRPWPAYAGRAIRNALDLWVRTTGIVRLPLNHPTLPAASRSYEDTIPDRERDAFSDVREALQYLPAKLRDIVVRRHLLGISADELAAEFGVTRRTVDRWETEGIQQLRELLS